MAKAATSRIQKSDVRCQNFKVSPMATIFKIMNNAGDLDTPAFKKTEVRNQMSEFQGFAFGKEDGSGII